MKSQQLSSKLQSGQCVHPCPNVGSVPNTAFIHFQPLCPHGHSVPPQASPDAVSLVGYALLTLCLNWSLTLSSASLQMCPLLREVFPGLPQPSITPSVLPDLPHVTAERIAGRCTGAGTRNPPRERNIPVWENP